MTPPIKTLFGRTADAVNTFLAKASLTSSKKNSPVSDPIGIAYENDVMAWLRTNQPGPVSRPSQLPFKTLKQLSRALPLAGVCINTLKHEVTKTRWDLVPIDKQSVDPTHIDKVYRLLAHPNRNRQSFRWLLDQVVDDILSIDAGVVEKVRNRGGEIVELWARAGDTIVPIYDEHGVVGDPAYVQILEPDPKPVAAWSNEDMIRMMMNPQGSADKFGYGMSPVETAVVSITSMLMIENYNTTYFDKNTIPPAIINLGEDYTDAQIKKFRSMWIATLQGGRNQWNNPIVNSKTLDVKLLRNSNNDMQFMEYTMYLMKVIVAAFEMSPQDIGFTMDINLANGQVQSNISKNKGLMSLLSLIREYINNEIIFDFGYEKEFTFEWMDIDKEDELKQAEIDKIYMSAGIVSGNEIRMKRGLDPITGLEKPFVMTANGPVYFDATPLDEKTDAELAELRAVSDDDLTEEQDTDKELPAPKKEEDVDQGNVDGKDAKPNKKAKSYVQKAKKKVPRVTEALDPEQEKIELALMLFLQRRYKLIADYYLTRSHNPNAKAPEELKPYIDPNTGDITHGFFLISPSDYGRVYAIGQDQYGKEFTVTDSALVTIMKQRDSAARLVAQNRIQGVKEILNDPTLTDDEKQQKVENYLGVDEDQPNYTNPAQNYAMTEMQWALNAGILAGIKRAGGTSFVEIVNNEGPCEKICEPAIAKNPYRIEEASGMLPLHNFCRCGFRPVS